MVQATVEVSEEEAQGIIKTIFEDIKTTLRTPVLDRSWRVLATHPDYLELAWRALKPNVQTVFFEERADAVRSVAVDGMSSLTKIPPPPSKDTLTAVIDVFHYVNSKQFLAVVALRSATAGQQPKLLEILPEEKQRVAPGIPAGVSIDRESDRQGSEDSAGILDEINAVLGTAVAPAGYEALAHHPDALGPIWVEIKRIAVLQEYRQVQRALRGMAEDTIVALPYRMDIGPHVLRGAGLTERDIDEVRSTLDQFCSLSASDVTAMALAAVALFGKDRAARSPFPASAL